MTREHEERRYDLNPTLSNRTRKCTCCGGRRVREHIRVGTQDDPDYAVAVCPICDESGETDESLICEGCGRNLPCRHCEGTSGGGR